MADPFVAEIRMFPFDFPPKGWAFCNGQILPISQNTALFSLLGTTYGGDGKSTFALPDMQGNAAMHPGQGQGLSLRDLGEMGGSQSVTLLISEIPTHTHTLQASNNDAPADATGATPTSNLPAKSSYDNGSEAGVIGMYGTGAPNQLMAFQALSPAGGTLPHNNMQPTLVLNFCIALQGIFPARP